MRITNTMTANNLLAEIQRTQERILQIQKQAATGFSINVPSDDPIGAVSVMRYRNTLDHHEQFQANIATGRSRLEITDASLGDLSDLYINMKALILQMSDDSQSAEERQAASSSVSAALDQIIAIGNRKVEGRTLFGGSKTTGTPFVSRNGGVVYQGDAQRLQLQVSEGQKASSSLNGVDVFGAVTTQVSGYLDLNPAATATTKLSALNNGDGVSLGSVLLGDGVTTEAIDLTGSDTLGDVVTKLNTNAIGIVASIATSGGAAGTSQLVLTKAAFTVSAAEVSGGTTAADLGIVNTGTLNAVTGSDLDPALTDLTTLASLNNTTGGINLTGLTITNGSASGTVSLAGATTIQDLKNLLNASGLDVDARISTDGRKLDLVSLLSGGEFRVGENGGTSGATLGVLSMHAATQLSVLNRGQGVRRASDAADADLRITNRAGASFDVNLSAATTVQNVLTTINAATGGTVTATMSGSGGNGIVLTDSTGGAGNLSVTLLNDSFAARDLGIHQSVASATLTGTDVNPLVTGSVFAILTELQANLSANNSLAISQRGQELDDAFTRLLDSRATAGGWSQRLEMTDTRLQQESEQIKGLLSQTQDADLAELLTRLSQEQVSLQAALKVSATAMQLNLSDYL